MVETSRSTGTVLLGFGFVAVILGLAMSWSGDASAKDVGGGGDKAAALAVPGGGEGEPTPPPPPDPALVSALLRAGLDADALAGAGLNGAGASSLVSSVKSYLAQHVSDLPSADAAYATARVACDALTRKVQSGLASQEEVAALAQAKADLASATAARAAAVSALFAAGTAGLSEGPASALTAIRANRSWKLPLQYLVAERTEAEWVALRDALAGIKADAKYGEETSGAVLQLVQTADAAVAVSTAKTNLETYAGAVASSWNSAVIP